MRTIQREIKRGMVENLTTQLEIKYVYSVDVSEKKYKAEFKDKFKTITHLIMVENLWTIKL